MSDEEKYEGHLPFLEAALRALAERLVGAFGRLGDPYLVRARIGDRRVKPRTSVTRKARRKGWTFTEALEKCPDLVGFRVVCNNLQDIRRSADLLEESLREEKIEVRRQDHIKKPKGRGYRAIHLDIKLPVVVNDEKVVVGCEVQIRSLLQDSWARLSRVDIYTNERSIPRGLLDQMGRLSELLNVADGIADDIRRQISRPRKGKPASKGAALSASSLAFLYRTAFGADAPDYVISAVLRDYAQARVRTDGLEAALLDTKLLQKLRSGYRKSARYFGADDAQVFRWVVHAVIHGEPAAIQLAAASGEEARDEIDTVYRNEVMSGVPESWEEFAEFIEAPPKDGDIAHDICEWANALDAIDGCGICGVGIVDAEALAEALADHYQLRGRKRDAAVERLRHAVRNSGVEVGGWGSGSLCAYHNDLMSKDD
jgi:ppGpp synthetase/RelA/SpoT-type nucleotidyltranferase